MATSAEPKEAKPLISTPVLVVGIVLLLLSAGLWYLSRPAGPQQGPALTADAKAYTRNLSLAEVRIKATLNALNQQIVEIEGKVTNNGDRHLRSVTVTCIFYDHAQQVVMRERVEIVRAKYGGIKPGETKPFRLPFDTLPANWNQAAPQLVIAEIKFS